MPQGTVKKLVADRGFGFIQGERGELFFHHSAVVDSRFDDLREGQEVEYQVDQGGGGKGKGPRATNVKVI
jgi:CspA family cold shock protein